MAESLSRFLLWLFVINLGIAFGAGLYEGRIVLSNWLVSSPDARLHWNAAAAQRDDTGLRFWIFVTTVPLTLLTVANLFAAWRTSEPARGWWLAAGVAALADRVSRFPTSSRQWFGSSRRPIRPSLWRRQYVGDTSTTYDTRLYWALGGSLP